MANFDPTRGHEPSGNRPALVLSADAFNAGPARLVIVLPITSKAKGIRSHVAVHPPEGGLRKASFIKCEDIRSVSLDRLTRRLGAVSTPTLDAVAYRVRLLLEI
jgi:mRNA interferase MazF